MPFSSPNDKLTLNGYFSERTRQGFLKIAMIALDNCKTRCAPSHTKIYQYLLITPFNLKLETIALQF